MHTAYVPHFALGSDADGDLIALGAQFDLLRSKYLGSLARSRAIVGDDRYDDVLEGRSSAVDEIVRRAATVPAHTPAGMRVKARMAEWTSDGLSVLQSMARAEHTKERILWSLVSDLLAASQGYAEG